MLEFNKLTATIILLVLCKTYLYGQPDSLLIINQARDSGIPATGYSSNYEVEAEYLLKARQNIEEHRKGDVTIIIADIEGNPLSDVAVEINQITHDFLFGNIVFDIAGFQRDTGYKVDEFKKMYKELFNLAVFPFYWSAYESTPGKPQWLRNQPTLEWCLENGITAKGHPLGWTSPSGTPGWLLKLPEETSLELYKARIFNNVMGFKGIINIWDVVNEPVNTVPWEMAMKDSANNNNLRYNMKGIDVEQIVPWVEQSYKWAYQANPQGDFILNEYFTLAIPEIRDRFYRLIKMLLERNTPISGIGIQGHEPREMWFSPIEMYKTFDLYSEFGLPLHITEFIPQSSGKEITGWRKGIWTEEAQAEFASQFYTLAFGYPAVASITWWGFTDRQIWLEGGGLLDSEYHPKPVYNALKQLIKEEWMTKNLNYTTSNDGEVTFRGFYGQYVVSVSGKDGKKQSFNICVSKNENNRVKISL
jgi:GH35 family endo-1,4-beta-xylanase